MHKFIAVISIAILLITPLITARHAYAQIIAPMHGAPQPIFSNNNLQQANNSIGAGIDKICNAGLGNVLNKIPDIPGLNEARQMLSYQIELQSIPVLAEYIHRIAELSRLANMVPIGQVIAQLNNIDNLLSNIPGGQMKMPAIFGGIVAKLINRANQLMNKLQRTKQFIKEKRDELNDAYQNLTDPVKKAIMLEEIQRQTQDMQAIQQAIANQSMLNQALTKANDKLNNKLQNSELGKTAEQLKTILEKFRTKKLIKDFLTVANTVKQIKDLVQLKKDLDEVCGLLPNGSVRTKVEAVIKSLLGGELNNAIKRIKERTQELIRKASEAVSNAVSSGFEGDKEKIVKKVTGGLTTALLEELLNSLLNLVPSKLSAVFIPFRAGGIANIQPYVNPQYICDKADNYVNGHANTAYTEMQGEINDMLANNAGHLFKSGVNLVRMPTLRTCVYN